MNSENAPQKDPNIATDSQIRGATVSTIDGRSSPGRFVLRHLNTGDRVKAGLTLFGASWLIAIVFVLFPVIHFVMVPLFLLLGPVGFLYGYRSTERIESGTCTCPNCAKGIHFPAGRYKAEYKETCPQCLHALYVKF